MVNRLRITLAAIWICLMLTYLLGDVMRIFSGDFVPGEIDGMVVSQSMWLGMAALMLITVWYAWRWVVQDN